MEKTKEKPEVVCHSEPNSEECLKKAGTSKCSAKVTIKEVICNSKALKGGSVVFS